MSNRSVISIQKPVGKTPLEMIDLLRKKNPSLASEILGYAGRLDPMADGLLLVLAGKTNNERKLFEKLPKTYKCRALFGVETDTYDILGMFTKPYSLTPVTKENLNGAITSCVGKQEQPYPPYSSPRVNGHPLFWWAREGRLNEITIPTKQIEVYSTELLSLQQIQTTKLEEEIIAKLTTVTGEFRQETIVSQWKAFFQKTAATFVVAEMEVSCSSGTYIRSLIHHLGTHLSTGALALSITRTQVGNYTLEDALTLV